MTTMTEQTRAVTVGIDTHGEVHVAAVLDERGRLLATESFPSTGAGHRRLETWARAFGSIDAIGVEGTGSRGAGVARRLTAAGLRVIEVDRADHKARRQRGKSDPLDAEAAARAVQAGTATGTPKNRTGPIEAIRVLRVARRSAIKARSQAALQLRALVATAPDELRDTLRQLSLDELVTAAARWWPGDPTDALAATRHALRSIARRHRDLTTEIEALDQHLDHLVATVAPNLVALHGVGTDCAGQLLVTAGDNPDRLRNEAAFSHLCGRPRSRLERTHPPPSPQPRRRPPSQRRALPDRDQPTPLAHTHPQLHAATHHRRTLQARNHPLPQTLRRPRDLPRAHPHQPLTSIGASC